MSTPFIWPSELILKSIGVIDSVHESIRNTFKQRPEERCRRITIHLENRDKRALVIDVLAEKRGKEEFNKLFPNTLEIYGEESLGKKVALNNETKICVLLDMIDGTDFVELDIPLWCSAMVFFDPNQPKILASLVGLSTGEIYYASSDRPGQAFVCRDPNARHLAEYVRRPSSVSSFENASICFYGQKAANFSCIADPPDFLTTLKSISSEANFRIYTFAGNPMMVKLADRFRDKEGKDVCRGFDVIFDIQGQYLHDVVPGAYIAQQAGAYLCETNGTEITGDILAQKLLQPTDKMTYILASTKALAEKVYPLLAK